MMKQLGKHLKSSFLLPFQLVLVLWAIHLFQYFLGLHFGYLGVYPRTIFGLKGVLFAPLIHSDFNHIISNTPPLFFLSVMLLFFYRRVAIPAFIMIYFLTGLAVWGFGRPVFHIGISGVIYGLVAFIFWSGLFRRNVKSIALALIVVFYYGSMFMGILPGQEGISWESHLLGALVGIFTAYWYKESIEKDEERVKYSWELEGENEQKQFFIERDTFEQPKHQRLKEKEEDWTNNWWSNNT